MKIYVLLHSGNQVKRRLEVVSYNAQSLASVCRINDIINYYMRKDLIWIRGTRWAQGTLPVAQFIVGPVLFLSYGHSARSNRHSGVALCVNQRTIKPHLMRTLGWPTKPCLCGRTLFLRVKWGTLTILSDLFIFHPTGLHRQSLRHSTSTFIVPSLPSMPAPT